MAKIFISYSRKDTDFAKRLTNELQKNDIDFWIDWEGIPPTVDWWREIEKGIEEADVFLFIISPDSAKSKICIQEIDTAVKNGKRIIPIVVREIEWEDTPPQLGHLNYIFFSRDDNFDTAVNKLMTAIQTDYEWASTHRRLQVKALEWERINKENSFLLRGKDLQDAELQLATNTSKEPHPTDLQREYVFKSRQATDRQRRTVTSISIAAVIALAALAAFGFYQAVQTKIQLVRSENLRLIAEANSILSDPLGNPETAALLSLQALQKEYFPAGDSVLVESISRLYTEKVLQEKNKINSAAFSPDGKAMATAGEDGVIRFWDSATGQPTLVINHGTPIYALAFSPNGERIAMADNSGNTRVININSGDDVLKFKSESRNILHVAFSPEGNYLLADGSKDMTASVWDISSGNEILTLDIQNIVLSVAFSPDGNYLFIGDVDGLIQILDLSALEFIGTLQTNEGVTSISVSPDGKMFATGSYKAATIWDLKSQKEIFILEHQDWVNDVAFSPDGKFLLTGGGDFIARIWDVKTGSMARALIGHTDIINAVAFSPDGTQALTGSKDQTARLWNANVEYQRRIFDAKTDVVMDVAFSPDGKFLVAGSNDRDDHSYKIWDIQSGSLIKSLVGNNLGGSSNVMYSTDGKFILTSKADGSVSIWDANTAKLVRTIIPQTKKLFGGAYDAVFSPDGQFVLSGTSDKNSTATLWDANTGKNILTLQHPDLVTSVAFMPDGKSAVTVCDDKAIRVWDLSTGKIKLTTTYADYFIQDIAVSSDGKYFLAGAHAGGAAGLFDASTGSLVKEFLNNNDYGIYSTALSPDGKYALTGSFDRTARLWYVQSGELVRTFKLTDYVNDAVFSPDGNFVLTGSDDGIARIWDTDYHDTIKFACSFLFRDLTVDEINRYEIPDPAPSCP